jgi:hypothetical protein
LLNTSASSSSRGGVAFIFAGRDSLDEALRVAGLFPNRKESANDKLTADLDLWKSKHAGLVAKMKLLEEDNAGLADIAKSWESKHAKLTAELESLKEDNARLAAEVESTKTVLVQQDVRQK